MAVSTSDHAKDDATKTTQEPPRMDLESYISNYRGRTRVHRLVHIGNTSSYFSIEALKLAINEAKRGLDVSLYQQAVESLSNLATATTNDTDLDKAWINKIKTEVDRETARLESELKGYKNNLIKESIRMGYDDLGKHFYSSGEMAEAQKAYQREREYCQSPAHITQMQLHLITVLIDQRAWHSAEVAAGRIQSMPSKPGTEKDEAKVNAVFGLATMSQRKYEDAAKYFLKVHEKLLEAHLEDPNDDGAFNDVLTPNDVATYGALCALASFSRQRLQTEVLDNTKFRAFLELEPHLRRAISAFVSGRYRVTLSLLESYRTDFLLDIYLQPHLESLYQAIRSKAVTEYFSAFTSIDLNDLGKVVGAAENDVNVIVAELIKAGDLNARLDLEKRLLVANVVDRHRQVQIDALQMSEDYQKTALERIRRMEVIAAGLEVKNTQRPDAAAKMDVDGANVASRLTSGFRR